MISEDSSYEEIKQNLFSFVRNIEKHGDRHFDTDEYTACYSAIQQSQREFIARHTCKMRGNKKHMKYRRPKSIPRSLTALVWLKNERIHNVWQISVVLRSYFRQCFDVRTYQKWGHFLDKHMNWTIHKYMYSVDHPFGNIKLPSVMGKVRYVVLSTDGRYLFTSDGGSSITVMDMVSYRTITQLNAHCGHVRCLAYRFGFVAYGCSDSQIHIWDAYNLVSLTTALKGHTASVNAISFDESGDFIVSGSADRSIKVWSMRDFECLRSFNGHTSLVTSVRLWNGLAISGSEDRSLRLWDVSTRIETDTALIDSDTIINASVIDIQVNCDGSMVACVIENKSILVFSLPTFKLVQRVSQVSLHCCFHPWIPYLLSVSGIAYFSVNLYDVRNGERIHTFIGHSAQINHVCFSADRSRIISISQDRSLRVWEIMIN